ncbi:MAG TPA: hypothetical protein VFM05_03655, partial [Candidatus Saccharimonadales bacterium]|nr:hypothetical protein [Candidatus Saccharimonadales bacterium]
VRTQLTSLRSAQFSISKTHVLNHVDVVWGAPLAVVTENEINDTRKPDKPLTPVEPKEKSVKQEELRTLILVSYPDRKWRRDLIRKPGYT